MKKLHLDDENFLVDADGIRFRRNEPLVTIECKLQKGWTPLYSRDFQKAVKEIKPAPNAYLDTGCINHIVEDHHFEDGTPVTTYYEIHRVELYKLGE